MTWSLIQKTLNSFHIPAMQKFVQILCLNYLCILVKFIIFVLNGSIRNAVHKAKITHFVVEYITINFQPLQLSWQSKGLSRDILYVFSTLGNVCVRCGSAENLEIDHIDASTKAFYISKLWSVSKAKFEAEVAKCQILCNSCHYQKSIEFGDFCSKKSRNSVIQGVEQDGTAADF